MKTKHVFVRTQAAISIGIMGLLAFSARGQSPESPSPARFRKTGSSSVEKPSRDAKHNATELLGKLPMSFEPNVGQTGSDVRFLARGSAYALYLMEGEAALALNNNTNQDRLFDGPSRRHWRHRGGVQTPHSSMFHMKFEGANLRANIVGLQPLPGKINYFMGDNPNNWHTNVPTFASVNYEEIYPGIDLRFYGDRRRVEYDFKVKPGADADQIALRIQGATRISVDDAGDLLVSMPSGEVELHKPVIYQGEGNASDKIGGNYVLDRDRVTFQIGDYDHSKPLIIDPAVDYSTYLGGSSYDYVTGIAVDSVGHAYVTGITWSLDFPTTSNALNPGPPPSNTTNVGAAFVTELSSDGTSLLYSSYLTGSNGAFGEAIALDSASPPNVYVTGGTCSTDFPTTPNAYLPTFTPANCTTNVDADTAFVTKLNPSVSGVNGLVYSTYLGGNGYEYGAGIAVDAGENIYVTGVTSSSNFPITQTAFQSSNRWAGAVGSTTGGDAFVSRIDPHQSGAASLVYSTYLGGSGNTTTGYGDDGYGISADSAGNVYVAGYTDSLNFPTTASAYSQVAPGSVVNGGASGFLTRIDTNGSGGSSLIYSTYLGGSTASGPVGDEFYALALGPSNLAYITGQTASPDFPVTPGSFRSTPPSSGGAVVLCIIDTTQSGSNSLFYSTYLSGNTGSPDHYNWGFAVAVDPAGNAYVTGTVDTTDFPVTPGAFQTSFKNTNGGANSFVSEIMPLGNGSADLVYSTYYGGSGAVANYGGDWGYGIALDSDDNVYIGGFTESTDFPITTGALQTTVKGPYDGFVAKLTLPSTSVSSAQAGGQRPVVAPSAVELGFTETANGNLHLEIPLGSFPQRGAAQPLGYSLVYDSFMWIVNPATNRWNPGATGLTPSFGQWWSWRLGSQDANNAPHWSIQSGDPACANAPEYFGFFWGDNSGAAHFFPIRTDTCASNPIPSGDALALDASGYHMYVTNFTNAVVYAPDGTLVAQTTPKSDSRGAYINWEDSNGNYLSSNNTGEIQYDTLGREVAVIALCGKNVRCYKVLNSQGQYSTYKATYVRIPVKSNFGQSGVSECTSNCTVSVIASLLLPDTTSYSFKYDCDSSSGIAACGSPSGQAAYYGELISLTFPTGGQIAYSYTNFTDSYGGKDRWLNQRTSGSGVWTYTPQVLSHCSQGTVGCRQQVTVRKPSGDHTVTIFTLNGGAWPVQTQLFSSGGALLSSATTTWDFSQTCPTGFSFYCSNGSAAYVRKIADTLSIPVAGGSTVTKQTIYGYDSPQTANVTAVKEWGYYSGSSPSFPSVADRATYMSYLTTGTNNINRPLKVTICNNSGTDATNCPGGGSRVSQTLNTYDSYSSCPSGLKSVTGMSNHDDANFGATYTQRGNATQLQKWVSGSTFLTTQLCYDSTSQIYQSNDPLGNPTSYDYTDNFFNETGAASMSSFSPPTPTNAYPKTITTGGLTTTFGYYFGSGKEAFTTDPNNQQTSYFFSDPLDRPTLTQYPIGWKLANYTSATQGDSYTPVANTMPSTSCTSCLHNQVNLDAWGRKVNEKLVNAPGGAINVDTVYDSSGRVQSLSHAYVNTSDPSHVYETFAYDALDRRTSVTHPDNQSSQVFYGPLVSGAGGLSAQQGSPSVYGYAYPVLTVDEAGRKKREEWIDGFGRIIEVDEPDSQSSFSSPLVTLYTYDALDNLTQVVQGVQARTFTYDGLARRTSMTTPEAGTDNFYFTKSDNVSLCAGSTKVVCRRTDARGVTTTDTYDSLSRLTGKSYSNGQGSVTFTYDQGGAGAFALGRLTNATDPSGSETYAYNQMGRITQLQKKIGSTTFPISYLYNTGGQLTRITYPSNRVVNQNVDNIGLLNTIVSGTTTYASIPEPPTGYNAAGQPLTFTYANGVVANFGYSSADRDQMTSLSYTKGSTTLFSLNYGYMNGQANCGSNTTTGNDGLIRCIQDNVDNGRSVIYGYDSLNRLSSAVTNGSSGYGKWGLSWSYDRYGNRVNQSVTAGTGPSNSLSFATTPVPPANPPGGAYTNRPDGYPFDASGNMQNDGENTLTYDAENCLTSSANSGSGTTAYTCDVHGIRVKKALQGGTTTAYVFAAGKDIAEYDYTSGAPSPGSPSREYIYLGSQLIATIQGASTIYHHPDNLSVRVTTDANGNKIGEQGLYPYGEQWYASNTTTKFFFTTYERDAESGNDYAMARFYINRFGRFSCVDPSLGSQADPQSWNRYAYARNNPVNITDPSGRFWLFKLIGVLLALIGEIIDIHTGGLGGNWLIKLGLSIAGAGFVPNVPGTGLGTPPTFPNGSPTVSQQELDLVSKYSTPPFLAPYDPTIDPAAWSKAVGQCAEKDFGVEMRSFTQSATGQNGKFVGWGADKMSNKGNNALITVQNNATRFSTEEIADISNDIDAVGMTSPKPFWHYIGDIIPIRIQGPYTNYTGSDLGSYIPEDQVHELGHSLAYITGVAVPPDKETGVWFQDCVDNTYNKMLNAR